MKIKSGVPIDYLKDYGFHYEPNLIFPTFKKIIFYNNKPAIIEVLIKNKIIYINKSSNISSRNKRFLKDIIKAGLIEK